MLDRKPRNKEFQFYSGNFKRLKLLDFFNPKSAIRNPKSCLNGLFVQALSRLAMLEKKIAAIRDDDPVMFFQHKLLFRKEGHVPEEDYIIPIGQAEVKREGKDVTLLTYGSGYYLSTDAADELAKLDIEAEVLDLRTIKPVDMETVAGSIKKTHRGVIVHEACLTSGFGAEIAARIGEELFDYLDAPVLRVAAKDVPIPFSPALENYVLPQTDDIVEGG